MNLELLTQFTHEVLKYNDNIKVVSYSLEGIVLNLIFNAEFGEAVHIYKWEKWLSNRRNKRIEIILS